MGDDVKSERHNCLKFHWHHSGGDTDKSANVDNNVLTDPGSWKEKFHVFTLKAVISLAIKTGKELFDTFYDVKIWTV